MIVGTPLQRQDAWEPDSKASAEAVAKHFGGKLVEDGESCYLFNKRNYLMDNEGEWLLWHDSDVIATPQQVQNLKDKMLANDLLILSAAVPYKKNRSKIIGSKFYPDYPGVSIEESWLDYKLTGLQPVDWFGLGLCLMRLDKIKQALTYPWFEGLTVDFPPGHPQKREPIGEDIAFCIKLASIGVKLYIDCDTKVKHIPRRQTVLNPQPQPTRIAPQSLSEYTEAKLEIDLEISRLYKSLKAKADELKLQLDVANKEMAKLKELVKPLPNEPDIK